MSEWTKILLMATVMALVTHLCIKLGLSFEGFVIYNMSVLVAWVLRRTP